MTKIRDYREFHRPDWPEVVQSTGESLLEYDDYFDLVAAQVDRLESLWMKEPPL